MIREATPQDLPQIMEMAASFAAGTGIEVPFDSETFAETAMNLIQSANGLLLICDSGMLGALLYPHFFNRSALFAQELFWWVEPEKRGDGAGLEMWAAFEAWGRANGAKHISMVALASQKPVGRLYERKGYKQMESSYVRLL